MLQVLACHTRVDVVWQDGTKDADGAATAYAPAKHVDGYYEFWPQDYVVGKAVEAGGTPPVGVVESVNHDQRLCYVTWRGSSAGPEIVPVYEIAPHPDFSFKVGDVVLRLPKSHDPHATDDAAAQAAVDASEKQVAEQAAPAKAPAADNDGDDDGDDEGGGEEGAGEMNATTASSLKAIGEIVAVSSRPTAHAQCLSSAVCLQCACRVPRRF